MPHRRLPALFLSLVLLVLAGCPSLGERPEAPPSLERAHELERGDMAGAARVYEQLAGGSSGSDRNGLLLHGAYDDLLAHRADDAARLLGLVQGELSADQATERALLNVHLALERGARAEAARQLAELSEPQNAALARQYRELRARAGGGVLARHGAGPRVTPNTAAGPHVALLLPLTGRTAAAAGSVRDGFLTAYYQTPAAERPRLRVYDTGATSVADAIADAAQQGAEFIVGPLTREEVTAAADAPVGQAALLALNFLPPERAAPAGFFQFALSPEDEARAAAHRVLEDHHHRGVALVPTGDWGTRVLAAFRQELLAGGGELLATAQFDASRTDYAGPITEVLRISDSTARFKRLESVLGTKLQFEPRRRGDIEFIFAPAQANTERLLRPQLRFHFAGDIPTYATSEAFEPELRANEDLDGLIFPDMPWILGGELADAVRAAAREAWPSGGPARGRLFAFGFDAFRLAQALRTRAPPASVHVSGLTGQLSIDSERHVRRELGWAQLHGGELRVLAPGDSNT
ncbi:MAG: penicillin-binding protein activator [Gammaproteobacteria bacterium]|nr:penicillin-binding protein activator [Gammaproteobacteria bacterium]MBV9696068.1 penicillin-binding protein activator [Gammaproteobacteria bacterium]